MYHRGRIARGAMGDLVLWLSKYPVTFSENTQDIANCSLDIFTTLRGYIGISSITGVAPAWISLEMKLLIKSCDKEKSRTQRKKKVFAYPPSVTELLKNMTTKRCIINAKRGVLELAIDEENNMLESTIFTRRRNWLHFRTCGVLVQKSFLKVWSRACKRARVISGSQKKQVLSLNSAIFKIARDGFKPPEKEKKTQLRLLAASFSRDTKITRYYNFNSNSILAESKCGNND